VNWINGVGALANPAGRCLLKRVLDHPRHGVDEADIANLLLGAGEEVATFHEAVLRVEDDIRRK
jgi:hypothetical protein